MKKENVKITDGKNAGKTLIGTVHRSLEPNRHKFGKRPGFAYLIKFNKNDNEADEMSNDIPNASDGITMHTEPTQRSQPRRRRR